MYNICADHAKIDRAAGEVDKDIEYARSTMGQLRQEVLSIAASWKGQDYLNFQEQWNTLTDSGSPVQRMLAVQEAYAVYLRHAAARYRQAQAHAITRANK